MPAQAALAARTVQPFHTPPSQPNRYCPIPQRLITDLHDTPLAIGLYALVGRLYFVLQAPVPLSVPDVRRYDPTLSRGAVIRAFNRLVTGGWVVATTQRGQKTRYVPTRGWIKGIPHSWQMAQPRLGRPPHVNRLALDRALLDVCMGKLTPHPVQTAPITRYVTTPALSLTEVGCYALSLAGLPRETPALRWLGLTHDGQACSLPTEDRLLALISQRPLALDETGGPPDTALTVSGTRKLGMAPVAVHSTDQDRTQPLFFVPPEMIGSMIRPMIGSMIGSQSHEARGHDAPASAKTRSDLHESGITWESRETNESRNPPPQTNDTGSGGDGAEIKQKNRRTSRAAAHQDRARSKDSTLVIPNTEAGQLLRTMNVLPEQLSELAELSVEVVRSAIADANARPGIRDPAGWVVKLLRAHRDYGWKISPPAPRTDSPEALHEAFARYAQQQEDHAASNHERPLAPPVSTENMAASYLVRLWNEVQAVLQLQIPRQEFTTWIRPVILHAVEQGVAILMVPNAQVKAAIEGRYLAALRHLIELQVGETLQVRIILKDTRPHADQAGAPLQRRTAEPQRSPEQTERPDVSGMNPGSGGRPAWISPACWDRLPAMFRAALLGSTLVDGVVQAKSSYIRRLLETRYRHALQELLVAQGIDAYQHLSCGDVQARQVD